MSFARDLGQSWDGVGSPGAGSVTVSVALDASEPNHGPLSLGGQSREVYFGGAFETLTSDGLAEAAATAATFSGVFLGQAYCGGGAGEQAA